MIDHEGYPKLIDFGTAKFIQGRTFTMVGTPHYMAPETFGGKGYSFNADIWSLGVILYELLCCSLPFGGDCTDPYQVYDEIIGKELSFPKFLGPNFPAKGFIQRLLDRNPVMRTEGRRGPLKSDPWLKRVNWDDVIGKKIKPPFIPPTQIDKRAINEAIRRGEPADVTLRAQSRNEPIKAPPANKANWDKDF